MARGNRAADLAARKAADKDFIAPVLAIGLPPPGMGTLPPTPEYSSTDLAWFQERPHPPTRRGWMVLRLRWLLDTPCSVGTATV